MIWGDPYLRKHLNGINCWCFPPLLLTLNSETSFHHFSGILKTHRNFLRSFLEAPKIATKNTVVFGRAFDLPRFGDRLSDENDHQLTTPWFLRSRNALIFEASSPDDWGRSASHLHLLAKINFQVDFRLVSGRVFTSAKLRNLWNLFYK